MPIVESRFDPPAALRNGHVQTLLAALLPRRAKVAFDRERLELPDGDFLDLDSALAGNERVAILSHGLEGSSRQAYVRGMADALLAGGWDVLAWNFRGCSGEPNRLPRFYHSGETDDLAAVIAHAAKTHRSMVLVGFSLGGNVTLKYLGERPPHPGIVAAAAISVPIELEPCTRVLDRRLRNRIYLRHFLAPMREKIAMKARLFPDAFDPAAIRNVTTFLQFDGDYTAPLHGFDDAVDYWTRSSARQFLPAIPVPTLLLNAVNDPFLAPECFPFPEAAASRTLFLETPSSGGHVGFLDLKRGVQPWSERRVVEFFKDFHPPARPSA